MEVIYENSEICIINKPQGLCVQGGEGVSKSVDTLLSEQLRQKIFLVHRLDKETSGLLITAKTKEAAAKWTEIIAGKKIQKEYTALCFGYPLIQGKRQNCGTILGSVFQHGEEKCALTNFFVEKNALVKTQDGTLEFSLLRLTLGTGRMHQIRIQLSSVGSPIAGDDKHGDFKKNRIAKKLFGIKRLCLCSSRLSFSENTLDFGGKNELKVPLPTAFQDTINKVFDSQKKLRRGTKGMLCLDLSC